MLSGNRFLSEKTVSEDHGWTYDSSTRIISPAALSSTVTRRADLLSKDIQKSAISHDADHQTEDSSTLSTFHTVIGSVAQLEI